MTITKEENDKRITNLKDRILFEAERGNVVINTIEYLAVVPLDKIIEQPTEGLLYDLNRDKATILTFVNDEKWINDFAVALVIEKLKTIIEEYKNESNKNPTGI